MSDLDQKWVRLAPNRGSSSQNVLKSDLKKSWICPNWSQSVPLWSETWCPWLISSDWWTFVLRCSPASCSSTDHVDSTWSPDLCLHYLLHEGWTHFHELAVSMLLLVCCCTSGDSSILSFKHWFHFSAETLKSAVLKDPLKSLIHRKWLSLPS